MRKLNLRRAVFFSLGLHLMLALGFAVSELSPAPPAANNVVVELLPSPEDLAPVGTKRERVRVKDDIKKQIVEQNDSVNKEKPLKDAYLSKDDQRVLKETVAREHGQFRNAKDKKSVESPSKNAGAKAPDEKPIAKTRPRLDDLMGTSPVAMLEHKEKTDRQRGDGKDGPKSAQASQTDDYLRDLEQSAETMLNTREFKYYTYYSRIRRQLSQYWEPKVRDKLTRMFRQGRRIASDQDHVTKLLIVLNKQGTLMKVQVLTASGVNDLDDAATEAFRSAAPFPNPPKGIVEDDGTVKIRWDFVLES